MYGQYACTKRMELTLLWFVTLSIKKFLHYPADNYHYRQDHVNRCRHSRQFVFTHHPMNVASTVCLKRLGKWSWTTTAVWCIESQQFLLAISHCHLHKIPQDQTWVRGDTVLFFGADCFGQQPFCSLVISLKESRTHQQLVHMIQSWETGEDDCWGWAFTIAF